MITAAGHLSTERQKKQLFNDQLLRILTIPGLYGSDSRHWQTRWEHHYGFERVEQTDWENPDYDRWARNLLDNIEADPFNRDVLVIAHSLGCHLVIKSLPFIRHVVRGLVLVAPPDLDSGIIKKDLSSFTTSPLHPVALPGYLIYSENDPYATAAWSDNFGKRLGLKRLSVGFRGHINSDSHLGNWDEGHCIVSEVLGKIRTTKCVVA